MIPNYQELKSEKISECKLYSYHFFKSFYKKEIGKENNYIFNFKDNFLNDMSKIDKEFFEDFYKFDKKNQKTKFEISKDLLDKKVLRSNRSKESNESLYIIKEETNSENLINILNDQNNNIKRQLNVSKIQKNDQMDLDEKNIYDHKEKLNHSEKNRELQNENNNLVNEINITVENKKYQQLQKIYDFYENEDLVYEFAIYHPLKNNKTQEILISGTNYLHQLKDKIYCVLDEIQGSENNEASFFFIENCLYNDTRNPNNKILSSKILENKIRKLNCFTSYGNEFNVTNKFSNNTNLNVNTNLKTMNYNYINSIPNRDSDNHSQNKENINNQNLNDFNQENFMDKREDNDNLNNPNDDLKFAFYKKDLYSIPFYSSNEIYDEISMNDKKINEINFRIGYPYLFRHIDHCDHMIMLTDIRLLDECDRFDEENKCFVTFQKKLKRRICDACSFYYAKFISINDKITSDYKVLFYCESCLKKIHAPEFKDPTISNSLKLIPYFHD